MTELKLVWTFITAIPDLIKLLQALQKAIDQANVDRKVADDLKTIHAAFEGNDASKLNSLFNS